MADQKINALPSKTAPTTGDKMLMVGTAEEYLIDYDKLATAILNKLSSQSFSSLDTTAKTLLGAVNELNSKCMKVAGKAINSGDDLNDYTIPGIYNSSSSGITATLLNMPEIFLSGFSLLVLPISTAANVQVIYMGGEGGRFYIRSANSSGWQSWYKLEGTVISS